MPQIFNNLEICQIFIQVFNNEKKDEKSEKWGERNERENGLINSNGLLSKYRRKDATCWRIASFRNYPGPSASDCRLIAQVWNIPGDKGSFLVCKCFSIFLALPPFWNLLCPERSKFPWTGHEQYAPYGTIVSLFSRVCFLLDRPSN